MINELFAAVMRMQDECACLWVCVCVLEREKVRGREREVGGGKDVGGGAGTGINGENAKSLQSCPTP